MAKDPFAIPTPEDEVKRVMRQSVPPELRALMGGSANAPGAERRKRPRVTIDELNAQGAEAIKQKWPDLPDQLRGMEDLSDQRSTLEKAFDWVDLPRNIVANIISSIIGLDKQKLPRGAMGLTKVSASDILGHPSIGMKPGALRSVLGFIGDIGLDPLTYIGAGALTGTKVSRHAPALLGPAKAALKNILRLGPKAATATTGLAKAIEGIDLARHTWKSLGGEIAKRAATLGDDIGNAARKFFTTPGYAVEGRKLLRIPFTEVAGPTLKFGTQAKKFRAMGEVGEEGAQALRRIGYAGPATAAATQRVAAAKEKLAGPAFLSMHQKASLTEQLKGATRTREAASDLLVKGHAAAPEAFRLFQKAELGTAWDKLKHPILNALNRVFGNLYASSPFHQRELQLMGRATIGAANAERLMAAKIRPLVDDLAQTMVKAGEVADHKQAWDAMRHMLDLGSAENVAKLHADDAGRALWTKWAPVLEGNPKYIALRDAVQGQTGDWAKEWARKGIKAGPAELGYFPRELSKEAGRVIHHQRELAGGGQRGAAGLAGVGPMQQRVKRYTIVPEARDVQVDLFKGAATQPPPGAGVGLPGQPMRPDQSALAKTIIATPDEVAGKVPKDWKLTGESWPLSAAEHEAMLADPTRYKTLLGDIPEAQRATIPTLFESDPARAMGRRAAQQERATAMAEMQKMTNDLAIPINDRTSAALGPAGYRVVEPLLPTNPLSDVLGPSSPFGTDAARLAYPAPVADAFDRMRETFAKPEAINILLKASDITLGWFKRWALFAPAYVVRNVFQNAFGMTMAGGSPLRQAHWAISPEAKALMKAIAANNFSTVKGTVKVGKLTMLLREVIQIFIDHNGALGGKSIAEFMPSILRGPGTGKNIAAKVGRGARAVSDVVRNANAAVEIRQRFGGYMAFIEQGFAPREAMMKTLLAMPDLSDITQFERSVGTRIWPWFRWLRRNSIGLQLGYYLPNRPQYLAAAQRFPAALEGFSALWRGDAANVPDELRPEWMREAGAGQIIGNEKQGTVAVLNNWFPFEDVQALMGGLQSPQELTRHLVSQTRPGLKFIAETATGQDVFRRRPIQPFTMSELIEAAPASLVGASGTPLDNLFAMRPLREAIRRIPEQPTAAGKLTRLFGGGLAQNVSSEAGLEALDYQIQNGIAEARRMIGRAKQANDKGELTAAKAQLAKWIALQARRQRLGLKVPKATQKTLAQHGWMQPTSYQ